MTTIRVIASTILFASFPVWQSSGLAQVPPQAQSIGLSLRSAPLNNVIDGLARYLRIDYVLDPSIATNVLVTTYGDGRRADARAVFDLLLQSSRARTTQPSGDSQAGQTVLTLIFLEDMTGDKLSELVLHFAGQEPVELFRNISSNLLIIRSRAASVN